jgi:hypothetical protein
MPVNSIASLNSTSDAEVGSVLIIPTASQLERMKTAPKKPLRRASAKGTSKSSGKPAVRNAKSSKRPASRRVASAFVNSGGLN